MNFETFLEKIENHESEEGIFKKNQLNDFKKIEEEIKGVKEVEILKNEDLWDDNAMDFTEEFIDQLHQEAERLQALHALSVARRELPEVQLSQISNVDQYVEDIEKIIAEDQEIEVEQEEVSIETEMEDEDSSVLEQYLKDVWICICGRMIPFYRQECPDCGTFFNWNFNENIPVNRK